MWIIASSPEISSINYLLVFISSLYFDSHPFLYKFRKRCVCYTVSSPKVLAWTCSGDVLVMTFLLNIFFHFAFDETFLM